MTLRRWLAGLAIAALSAIACPPTADAAKQWASNVCETTTTPGQGPVDLDGAASGGYRRFVGTITSGNTFDYTLRTGSGTNRKLEEGVGTFTDGSPDTIARSVGWSTDGTATPLTLAGTSTICISFLTSTFDGDLGDITTSGAFSSLQIDANAVGSAEIATDAVSADELNATGVESELEGVLDLADFGAESLGGDLDADTFDIRDVGILNVGSLTEYLSVFGIAPRFQIHAALQSQSAIASNTWEAANPYGAGLLLSKSRSGTIGSHTAGIVQTDDETGVVHFGGSDGDEFIPTSSVHGFVDGTPGNGDMPGRLEFRTTPDGSFFGTTRMTIKADGGVIIGDGTTSPGSESLLVENDVSVADDLSLTSDGAIINIGAANDVTLTHSANQLTVAGGDFAVPDDAYNGGTWDGNPDVPTKNAIRDALVALTIGGAVLSDGDYGDIEVSSTGTVFTVESIQTLAITTADAGTNAFFGWDDAASAYENLTTAEAEAIMEPLIDTLANLTSVQGFTITLADAGADAIWGWDDSANAYENLTRAEVQAVIGDIALTTETSGNYVKDVADGSGVDGTAAGEGATYTPTLDLTELNTFTLGAGAATGIIFDAGATDPAIETSSATFTIDIGGTNETTLTATAFSPGVDAGSDLGTTALAWNALHGDTGFVLNIENGDWVATHTAGILTIGTGTLKITTPTNNTTSVLTTDATQTLTNKSIVATQITAGALNIGNNAATVGTIELANGTSNTLSAAAGVLSIEGAALVPTSISLTAGVGLSGGGDLSANRTFTLDTTEVSSNTWGAGAFTAVTFDAGAVDPVWTYSTQGTVQLDLAGFAGPTFLVKNTEAGAAGPTYGCYHDSATPAANDINCEISLQGEDSAGNTQEYAQIQSRIDDATSTSEDTTFLVGVATAGTVANELALTGAAFSPFADGGNSLGTTALGWQNLFGNTGFVWNIEGGDWVATHTAGILTIGTGTLKITTPTNNTTSVLTTDATQTLTNKSIVATQITAGALNIGNNAFTTGTIEMANGTANTISCSAGDCTIEGNGFYRAGGTDVAVADGGTGASALTNLITLATHTTGSYVEQVADGTGIDGTANAEQATYTPTLDLTEISSMTWGSGNFTTETYSGAGAIDMTWTYSTSNVGTMSQADAGATGPTLEIYQDSATPAAADVPGALAIYGEDSASNKQEYGRFSCAITDATSTSEDSTCSIFTYVAGSATEGPKVTGTKLALPASGTLDFGAVNIISDSAGTTTLANIDAVDAATESTIEAAIDTLANLTSIQSLTVTFTNEAADAIFGWDDSANAYEVLTRAEVQAVIGDIALTTETSGNYVKDVADGTGIDGTAAGEGATYTPTFDATEISSATWGAGAFTTFTFDAGAVDPTLTFGSGTLLVEGVTSFRQADAANAGGSIKFLEDPGTGSNFIAFLAPASITSDVTCTFENDSSPIPDSCVGDGSDAGGAGSQTPWTSDIDANTFDLLFDNGTGIADVSGNPLLYFFVTNPDGIVGHNLNVGSTQFAGLWVTGTDAGDGGPFYVLYQNSASPAVNDLVGGLSFHGNNSTPASKSYTKILGRIKDKTAATEDGLFELLTTVNGSAVVQLNASDGVSIGATDQAPGAGDLGFAADKGLEWGTVTLKSGTDFTSTPNSFTLDMGAQSGPDFVVRNTDDGVLGPFWLAYQNSASPAAGDQMMVFDAVGKDSGGNLAAYAEMTGGIIDPADASEDGVLKFRTAVAGDVTALGSFTTTTTNVRFSIANGVIVGDSTTYPGDGSLIVDDDLKSTDDVLVGDDINFTSAGAVIEWENNTANTMTCTGGSCTIEGNVMYRAGGTDVAVADGGTGASALTNLITLATHTTGSYVEQVADGTGIDGTANAEQATYTPTLDLTEVSSTTWGAGAFTTMVWDAGATDPTATFASNSVTWSNAATFSLGTSAVLTTGTIEVGAASDTTVSRLSAAQIGVEGKLILTNANAGAPALHALLGGL